MLVPLLAFVATPWLVEASTDNPSYNPHGVVAFIRTGERTPFIEPGTSVLSALGAQQMYTLGQLFRGRYIDSTTGDLRLGQEPLVGVMPHILDNDQLLVQTLATPHLYASAQSFMQGLYPPYSINSTRNGPVLDATGILSNGTAIDFPLGGYQYAQIQALSPLDPQSVYIAGNADCPYSAEDSLGYESTPEFVRTKDASRALYQSLDASIFNGVLTKRQLNYYNALEIHDYLSYAYNHDRETYQTLTNDSNYAGVFDRVRWYADEYAWYRFGNTSTSSSDSDKRAMAGKTLAALILGQFQDIVRNNGNMTNGASQPLTFLFGDMEPFISLAALTMLDMKNVFFRSIPPFASTMVFELFSTGKDRTFPSSAEDLWVRFRFQNGTDYSSGDIQSYAMFNRSPLNTDMPWLEFQDMFARIMTSMLSDWCDQCSSTSLFCWGVDNSTISVSFTGRQSKISPTVAGVIGAAVTLAIAGLFFALAMLLAGVRFHRVQRNKKSGLGGFKGSTKLASDADLNLPKNDAPIAGVVSFGATESGRKQPHERVGSWELRQKEFGDHAGDLGEASPRGSFEAIEAAMSKPVQPEERV